MEPSSSAASGGGGKAAGEDVAKPQAEKEAATTTENNKKKPLRFHVRPQLSISQWRLNESWMGAILTLGSGSNYYVTAIRSLLRGEVEGESSDVKKENNNNNNQRVIGLALEAFGYRDLRTAHYTKIYRCDDITGAVTQLQCVDYHYIVSTATYKSCILFFREDDFLPKCSYSFQYNGAVDYEKTVFLENLTSVDDLFAGTGDPVEFSALKTTTLKPSDVVKDWNLEVPERALSDRAMGKWGDPNGPPAPYGPLGF
jgi:hypothetical protein